MIRLLLQVVPLSLLLVGCGGMPGAPPAELIVANAKVATLDANGTMAQALAVRGGRIVAVGDDAAIQRLAGPGTRRIDAGGRTLIPGLIDSHIHAVRAALSYSTEVNWIGAGTVGDAMARLRAKAAASPAGSWLIVAGGWTEQQFAEKRRPTLAEITDAAPDNPVYIQLFYASVLMTPKAQTLLGIDAASLPSGISAERDTAGSATGWWDGSIISISRLFDRLPKPTEADYRTGTRGFFSELNRLGVTGVVDTGGFSIAPPQYGAMLRLWRERALTVRVAYHLFAQNAGAELEELKGPTQLMPMGYGDDMLKFNGIGERITTAMYNNNAPDAAAKAKFYDTIRWAAEQRMSLTVHWSDGTSVGHLLELFERIDREVTPIAPLRWSIAHLEDAPPDALARMAALGVGWTVQISMYYNGDRELRARGEAARHMPPLAAAQKAGVHVGAGTDAHRVATYNPFVVLQWLLDGRTVAGTEVRRDDELPSRERALRMYTVDGAWFSFDEDRRGSLEVGKLADFAILDQDYFSVPLDRIATTTSVLTVVGGKVVYSAAPFD